ncbi:MFS transporter [Luedemannella helvata]|uniref:MFS transporter n=1 Tax=Luedemannella helvata TaxID=349315 RepID=A0ABN2L7I9_9ACTN
MGVDSAVSPGRATVPAEHRRARAAVAAAYAVQGLGFAGVVTQVPALRDRFGFSELELSLVLLTVPVVAGVGSVLAGVLVPRRGSGPVLRVAGPAVCLGVALVGAATSLALFFPAVALFGLAVGAVDATMNMQGVAVQRRYGRSILASFHAWWSIAGIAVTLFTALTAWLEWPLWLAMGSVALVGGAVALAAGPSLVTDRPAPTAEPQVALLDGLPAPGTTEDHPVAAPTSATRAAIRWTPVVMIGIAVMIMYIAESSVSNWSAVLLDDGLHAAAGVAPLGYGAYLVWQLIGRVFADRVVGWIGPRATVAAGAVLGAIGFAAVATARVPWLAIIGFAVVGLGFCVIVPLSFSAAGALDPTGSGVVIARVNLFNYAGFVVGSALIGIVGEEVGVRAAFVVPAILALAIVPLVAAFRIRPAT